MDIDNYLKKESLYIIGPAGCGKTYLVQKNKGKNFLYLGPTNLISRSIGGKTYHKFLGIYKENLDLDKFQIESTCLRIIKEIEDKEGIYLDEISMVPSSIDCFISNCVRFINERYNKNIKYFRGGDPLQIPCINGISFTESQEFINTEKLMLKEVKRQQDKEWIKCLNELRRGNSSPLIENFEKCGGKVSTEYLNFLRCLTITPSNKKRNSVNYVAYILLSNLLKDEKKFEGGFKKRSTKGNEINFCNDYRIIFCTNSEEFSNGERGKILKVEELEDQSLILKILKENSTTITINIEKEDNIPFEGGYAVTSHAIQGQTIREEKIQILLDKKDFLWKTPGSLYNALSRTLYANQIHIHTRDIKEIKYLCRIYEKNLKYA